MRGCSIPNALNLPFAQKRIARLSNLDRIRKVLSAIFDSGELRIIDVTNMLSILRQSMNALMQYLKRKRLVKKTPVNSIHRIR
jgi:hypothetical protein